MIYLGNRPGARRVDLLFREAQRNRSPISMSAVNWGEVFYSLWKQDGEAEAQRLNGEIGELPLAILEVDRARATRAAEIKATHGLGYADSFAAALAVELSAVLVSADPEFAKMGKRLKVLDLPRHLE
jgi:predicted nucleic acid-binding protein